MSKPLGVTLVCTACGEVVPAGHDCRPKHIPTEAELSIDALLGRPLNWAKPGRGAPRKEITAKAVELGQKYYSDPESTWDWAAKMVNAELGTRYTGTHLRTLVRSRKGK